MRDQTNPRGRHTSGIWIETEVTSERFCFLHQQKLTGFGFLVLSSPTHRYVVRSSKNKNIPLFCRRRWMQQLAVATEGGQQAPRSADGRPTVIFTTLSVLRVQLPAGWGRCSHRKFSRDANAHGCFSRTGYRRVDPLPRTDSTLGWMSKHQHIRISARQKLIHKKAKSCCWEHQADVWKGNNTKSKLNLLKLALSTKQLINKSATTFLEISFYSVHL